MRRDHAGRRRFGRVIKLWVGLVAVAVCGVVALAFRSKATPPPEKPRVLVYEPRRSVDSSGFSLVIDSVTPWKPDASLAEVADAWKDIGHRLSRNVDRKLTDGGIDESVKVSLLLTKAMLYNYERESKEAYRVLQQARSLAETRSQLSVPFLYTIIYYQGVTALRLGENENCIMCRGESSCILPISPAARHTFPEGSHLAIKHFTEYLQRFPNDLEIRWLLNVAHMTLGEHPNKVDPRFLVSLEKFAKSEFDIGRFRDIGERVGVNRFNVAGGAILEDFDNDGRLDLATTAFDPTQNMAFYRNAGDGTFEDRSETAGVTGQLGGLYCVQADYDNDGFMDIFISRGAWLSTPIRPSLLRNKGDGTFADVTKEAGLLDPVNSNSAAWADYDNDGWVDLFICCERQFNHLYRNNGNGTFTDVAAKAGVAVARRTFCKGVAWIDNDNDGDSDLFLNYLSGMAGFFRNNGDGTFTEAGMSLGIDGPNFGFSCWAWDYNNDGWLDLFATSYDRTPADIVKGIVGERHTRMPNKLFRNDKGQGFIDETRKAGLNLVFGTMGSNFADFDNDGFLDIYLGTGDPNLGTLIPNRMFRNVGGKRFAEITGSSGTGHLQKGHAVACGDWDRDGDVDLFAQTGGAVPGDSYHNVLFDNPGQGNHGLTVKLVGKKTNRAAIGARIKAVTAGETPLTVHRHVTSGSSFGANTLEQTIGMAQAAKVATLEIRWPASGTTQVFRDIDADQVIEITEFEKEYRKLDRKPIPHPKPSTP